MQESKLEILIFLAAFVTAVVLEFVVLPQLPTDSARHRFVEHIVIALFAALVLGLTYELGLYEHRKRTLRAVLQEFKAEVLATLEAIGTLSPREVFGLLKDVASAPQLIPTLYHPPRSSAEYNFVEESTYFDKLIPIARGEIVTILGSWIHPDSHRNVRFLASDFVGKYQLHELANQLRTRAENKLQSWETLSAGDRDWVLNFMWAASRCEKPRYGSLGKLLITTPHDYIQEWILFVPRQMPDKELVKVVEAYLANNTHIAAGGLKAAVWALAALEKAGHSVEGLLTANSEKLRVEWLKTELDAAWRSYQLDPTKALNLVGSS